MTISPPKAVYKRPYMKTFLAFLQSKGWKMEAQTKGYYAMRAPESNGVKQDFIFRLPANENSRTFDELAFLAVETFSELYNIPLQELFDLLSKDIEALRVEIQQHPRQLKMKQAIVASAS